MSLIEWRKEFETGVSDVDHEHRELVELINRLHDQVEAGAGKEKIQVFLGEVFARISAHFALEETIMRKYRYDEYIEHKADHEELLDQLQAWRKTVGAQMLVENPEFDAPAWRRLYVEQDPSLLIPRKTFSETAGFWKDWRAAMNMAIQGHKPIITPATGIV